MTTYYISAAGNNSNNGTSTGTSWADTTNVNTTAYQAGDSVLFNGGDTISGALALTSANYGGMYLNSSTVNANGALSVVNTVLTSTSASANSHAYGVTGVTGIKFYCEFHGIGAGFSAGNDAGAVGIGNVNCTSATVLGGDAGSLSIGYYPDGHLYVNNVSIATLQSWDGTSGVDICMAVDLVNHTIWVRPTLSGNWNNSGSANPATNTGGIAIPSTVYAAAVVVGVEVWRNTTPDVATLRVNQWSWLATPPSGFGEAIASLAVSGSGSPLTIGSYGAGNGIISSNTSVGISGANIANCVAQNLTLTGGGNLTTTIPGVHFVNTSGNAKLNYLQLLNLTVSAYGASGIFVEGANATNGFNNVTISGCSVSGCTGGGGTFNNLGTAGIVVGSNAGYGSGHTTPAHTNVFISKCSVSSNPGIHGSANWSGSGIFIGQTGGTGLTDLNGNACGGLIDYCVAFSNGATFYHGGGPVGIWIGDAVNIVMQRCESYLNGQGIDMDGGCYNCFVQQCYTHSNKGQGLMLYTYSDAFVTTTNGCTIRFCISQNDGTDVSAGTPPAGLMIGNDGGTLTSCAAYNNTIYQSNTGACAVVLEGSSIAGITGHVCNNILDVTSGLKFIHQATNANPTSLIFDGNNYTTAGTFSLDWNGTTYTTLAAWKAAATQQEPHSGSFSTAAPGLTNAGGGGTLGGYIPSALSAYQLNAGSPMIAAGLDLQSLYSINPGTQDFFGNAIPNSYGKYDVGAYNFTPSRTYHWNLKVNI